MLRRISKCGVLLVLLAAWTPVYAASFTVNSLDDTDDAVSADGICADANGYCTLRAGVSEANVNADADEIVFAVDGTITLTDTIDFDSAVTVTGNGENATIVDGNANAHFLQIFRSANVTLNELTLTTMSQIDNEGSLALNNVTMTGFYSYWHRAIMNKSAATLTITDSTITANENGGINNAGELSIATSIISHNEIGYVGGGIVNTGTLDLRDSLIANNSGSYGGGLSNSAGATANIVNTTFAYNAATEYGGGLYNQGHMGLYNVTIARNVADSDTNATGIGGGIYNASGYTVRLANSLLSLNRLGDSSPDDCEGEIESLDYNVIGSSASGMPFCVFTGATTHDVSMDPEISPTLEDHGGASEVFVMANTSPLLDGGNPAGCFDHNGDEILSDQRGAGFMRPADGDSDGAQRCDIGAFERVTSETSCSDSEDNDEDGLADCDDDECSLESVCTEASEQTDEETVATEDAEDSESEIADDEDAAESEDVQTDESDDESYSYGDLGESTDESSDTSDNSSGGCSLSGSQAISGTMPNIMMIAFILMIFARHRIVSKL